MANQTITSDANHDDLTGRNAGEDITIQQGAKLTIDSYPQETTSGILGDILLTEGEVHVDGRYVREVAYSAGTGTLPTIGTSLTYGTSGTAKIIFQNSGTAASGVMTITIQGVLEEPSGTITDGSWSATVDTSRVGLLKVFGEDQIWDVTGGALCTLRITGDWYDIGVGTGLNGQVITLPHTGHQHAVWVETGSGTGVFEIWHRVSSVASAAFWSSLTEWGDHYECGFVFTCTPGSGTLTFGTSTNGGAPPAGARIRIPNVHMGTTTVGSPQTEITTLVLANYLEIVDTSASENVFIDHLNASSVQVHFNQVGGAVSDSAIGLFNATSFITACSSDLSLTNCAVISGNGLAGDSVASRCSIRNNIGGVTITDCVFYNGTNAANVESLEMISVANATFAGRNKIVVNRKNIDSVFAIRMTGSQDITNAGTLLLLNNGIGVASGCNNINLGDVAYGQLTSRPTAGSAIVLNAGASSNFRIDRGRVLNGNGVELFGGLLVTFNGASNGVIQNFGDVDAKLNKSVAVTHSGLAAVAGIANNITLRRLWLETVSSAQGLQLVNTASDITVENCSAGYNKELEIDATRVIVRGFHGAEGNINAATGIEADLVNCIATIFTDYFKSDTTGAVGLMFNRRGVKHLPHVDIVSGSPVWNDLGSMAMRTAGDQVVFTFPYEIKGHTGFQNTPIELSGVNTGNHDFEYDLDTGSGFSGVWQTANGANLSAETISPAGFGVKVRITCNASNSANRLNGFAILTTTTIADQKANLYPADLNALTITGLQPNSEVRVYEASTTNEVGGVENSGSSETFQVGVSSVDIVVHALNYEYLRIPAIDTSSDITVPVQQRFDRNYENP